VISPETSSAAGVPVPDEHPTSATAVNATAATAGAILLAMLLFLSTTLSLLTRP
jgi:hypothetical protein